MKIGKVLFVLFFCARALHGQINIEKWKIFELALSGPTSGNPFKDVHLSGQFIQDNDTILVPGFYDGEGIFKIRFMAHKEGRWNYVTTRITRIWITKKETLFVHLLIKIIMDL